MGISKNSNKKIVVEALVKRKHSESIEFTFNGSQLNFTRKSSLLPLRIISKLNPLDPRLSISKRELLRKLSLFISTNLKKIIFERYVSLNIEIPLLDYPDGYKRIFINSPNGDLDAFVTRDVARHGFQPDSLDLALDHNLQKKWECYDVIFTSVTDPYLNNAPGISSEEILLLKKWRQNSFFQDFEVSQNDVSSGKSFSISRDINILKQKMVEGNWYENRLSNASVLHGQLVSDENYIYLTDSTRAPIFSSRSNQWPSILYQNCFLKFVTPFSDIELDPIKTAVFIGGTNNWMHFVLEEIPRIEFANKLELSESVPFIFRSGLSVQIRQAISQLTDHPVIFLDIFTSIRIEELYYFYFENPLSLSISGDVQAALTLFDRKRLASAKERLLSTSTGGNLGPKRIMIGRESNLFRPLVNASKLQSLLQKEFGFVVVFLSKHQLSEVMEIFKDAQIVVGEYGAGLANAIFIQDSAIIFEIRGPLERKALEYNSLLNALGHHPITLFGRHQYISRLGVSKGQFRLERKRIIQALRHLAGE